jgi:hypothetical protein
MDGIRKGGNWLGSAFRVTVLSGGSIFFLFFFIFIFFWASAVFAETRDVDRRLAENAGETWLGE